jgi:hypothetical protein
MEVNIGPDTHGKEKPNLFYSAANSRSIFCSGASGSHYFGLLKITSKE